MKSCKVEKRLISLANNLFISKWSSIAKSILAAAQNSKSEEVKSFYNTHRKLIQARKFNN